MNDSLIEPIIRDLKQRPLKDIRISVIDRCNFRCFYCMPKEKFNQKYSFMSTKTWLNFDEIHKLIGILIKLGIKKVRFTGGEPLLRPKLPELITSIRKQAPNLDLSLTTNGYLLSKYVTELKKAGLTRLNVSLDALDEQIFQRIIGKPLSINHILSGLKAAKEVGFKLIKINMVVHKHYNTDQILTMVDYCRENNYYLRLIEFMDVGNSNKWSLDDVVTAKEIEKLIQSSYPISQITLPNEESVAKTFRFLDGNGLLGIIPSISQPFCQSCSRLRITADGKVYTCLFAPSGTSLKPWLRPVFNEKKLTNFFKKTWRNRKDRYSELRADTYSAIQKTEMFQLGG